jgi:uncharacterized membrane-anchored protein YitT (DUF2179 family)
MFSVLLLLAVKAINGAVLKHGIIGADGVEPISIMALFISLVRGRGFTLIFTRDSQRKWQAYLSISLDATGLLRFLAFWVARKGGASGPRLYFYLYLFFLACAAVVGNVSRRAQARDRRSQ